MNPTHLHLILNHIPVLATAFGVALLAFAVWRKNADVLRAAFAAFVLAALVAIPVYTTGEPAEEAVEGLPGVMKQAVERHEQSALVALVGIETLGALALLGLILSMRTSRLPGWVGGGVGAIAIIAGGLLIWTANLGGVIRHTEIAAAPQSAAEHDDD